MRVGFHVAPEESAELRSIIDEEVGRLTDKYRSPLILCDLGGQTHEQAAAQLRCPVGTVKSRLRAGSGTASVPAGAARPGSLARAPAHHARTRTIPAVPGSLLDATIRAATQLAAGRAVAAGAVSAVVATLVDGTLRNTSMFTLKLVAAALTAAGIIATAAGIAPQAGATTRANETRTAEPDLGNPKTPPRSDSPDAITLLARARYDAAQEDLRAGTVELRVRQDRYHVAPLQRSMRVLEAQRDLNTTKSNEIAALEAYLGEMKKAEAAEKSVHDPDFIAEAEYDRLEAELWLAQAQAGKDRTLPGPGSGDRPGSDPRSQALLARLEEPIPMHFPSETPLEDVLKYIRSATAGPDGEGIPIHVDPAGLEMVDKSLKYPVTIELTGVPLRRTLQLLADQLEMGYGIKDGMVTIIAPDFSRQNWRELLVVERGPFPETSPLQLMVQRAERGELTEGELAKLNEQLKAIEEATKRYHSIRMPPGMRRLCLPPTHLRNDRTVSEGCCRVGLRLR